MYGEFVMKQIYDITICVPMTLTECAANKTSTRRNDLYAYLLLKLQFSMNDFSRKSFDCELANLAV